MINLKRILVPTDLSEYSLAALEYASSFAVLFDARISLLYVAEQVHSPIALRGHDAGVSPRQKAEEKAMESLRAFIRARVPKELHLVPVARVGVPAEEIKRFAEDESVDVVVMATHGRTGIQHIVMGSVAETVVRHSRVPVLTVKPSRVRESIIRNEDIEHELHLR